MENAAGRVGLVCLEGGVVSIEGGAVRTDLLVVVAHVDVDMRMVKRNIGTRAHEFLDAYLDKAMSTVILEVRNAVTGHSLLHAFKFCADIIEAGAESVVGRPHGAAKNHACTDQRTRAAATATDEEIEIMNLTTPKFSSFTHQGLSLAYFDEGNPAGEPVLLVHGFASTANVNWVYPGWLKTLADAGYRVIALDNRGHGASDKPKDPEAYRPAVMAQDVIALQDHLGLPEVNLMGYSMGARISTFAALARPQRIRSLVLGGLGIGMTDGVGDWDPIADALLASSLDEVTHARGRMFRSFADQTKSDRHALAACIRGSRDLVSRQAMSSIDIPTLIAVGTKDDIAGSAEDLAALMPNARALDIPNRDHMLAVGDKVFKAAVLDFYAGLSSR